MSEAEVLARPTGSCGCGFELVWVEGRWEHNAAPSLWGDDHDTDLPPPTGEAREFWDVRDGVTPPIDGRLPEFRQDIQGKCYGGAYWNDADYRVRMSRTSPTMFLLTLETDDGIPVDEHEFSTDTAQEFTHIAGKYRTSAEVMNGMPLTTELHLRMGNNRNEADLGDILDDMCTWLGYALGYAEWDGGEEWE